MPCRRALAQAKAKGHRLVLLRRAMSPTRKSGFKPIPKGRATMPPGRPARLLVCELVERAFDGVSGPIRPDWSAA
jgi:predicted N-acetyltransferase YhbS